MPKALGDLLCNLPSRGNFVLDETQTTRAKSYVCAHDSRPPVHQRLNGDSQPQLIRMLMQKKNKDAEQKRKQQQDKEKAAAGKRPASSTPAPAKRQNTAGTAGQTMSPKKWTPQQLRGKTNADLGTIMKGQGGKIAGKKKDELIQGILDLQQQQGL